MSADDFTGPENAAQRMQAKRYRARINKRGRCSACLHRDKTETYWGRSICTVPGNRQYPTCDQDGRQPKFEFDDSILEDLANAA